MNATCDRFMQREMADNKVVFRFFVIIIPNPNHCFCCYFNISLFEHKVYERISGEEDYIYLTQDKAWIVCQ